MRKTKWEKLNVVPAITILASKGASSSHLIVLDSFNDRSVSCFFCSVSECSPQSRYPGSSGHRHG